MEPLTGFADRVQYPLETPSRHGLRFELYDSAGRHCCATYHIAFGTFRFSIDSLNGIGVCEFQEPS